MLKLFAILKTFMLKLQLFAEAGTLVNATTNYVNAYTGDTTEFSGTNDLSPTMKTFYDTNMLINHRDKLIYSQLGQKQSLPAGHGRSVEWRKWNTLPNLEELVEGVIPTGKKLGMTSVNVQLTQYGEYVSVTDLLELHALDNVIAGATEELGAASGKTNEILVRNVLVNNPNILFADAYNGTTYVSTPSTEAALQTALASYQCNLTYDMVNKAATNLETGGADPFSDGNYVAVVHPHVAYDLRKDPEFKEIHKYAHPEELYNGEIGEIAGVRFLKSRLAPIIKSAGQTYATYKTLFFGKDAFGYIDPAGAGLQTIIKTKEQIGGPLNQFSTINLRVA